MTQAVTTLHEKLGGASKIDGIVAEFFRRVTADSELKGYFGKTNMTKLVQSMSQFVGAALGGPKQYNGRPIRKAHQGLKIAGRHFDLFTNHMAETLKWAKFPADDAREVMRIFAPLKADIVEA